ncbi:MAG TPA: NADPH-dependent F420 reductase [Candidatus Methylomirabilis sp.]|nr:NADPH-dependent F420 reductase [Candidatus Methylomirabilis sp.]
MDHARRNFLRIAGSVLAAVALAAQPNVAVAQATGSPLRIGIVGAGREGSALGTLFVKAGHPVKFSSRHPENLKSLVTGLGPLAQAGTVEEAIAFGDVVVIVIPYAAMEQIGKAHAGALAQKVLVIDVSNPIPRRDGEDFVKSVGDQGGPGLVTAKLLSGAHIVRAFNAIGSGRLAELAHRAGEPVGVPIAGDDPKAIEVAQSLIREIGFEPVLVGGLAMGRHLVPGTPLAGEHTAAQIRQIAGSLH